MGLGPPGGGTHEPETTTEELTTTMGLGPPGGGTHEPQGTTEPHITEPQFTTTTVSTTSEISPSRMVTEETTISSTTTQEGTVSHGSTTVRIVETPTTRQTVRTTSTPQITEETPTPTQEITDCDELLQDYELYRMVDGNVADNTYLGDPNPWHGSGDDDDPVFIIGFDRRVQISYLMAQGSGHCIPTVFTVEVKDEGDPLPDYLLLNREFGIPRDFGDEIKTFDISLRKLVTHVRLTIVNWNIEDDPSIRFDLYGCPEVITTVPTPTTPTVRQTTRECTGNKVWRDCGCETTCNDRMYPETSTACTHEICTPGCFCCSGFVLHQGECINDYHCPCFFDGAFYQFGQRVRVRDCRYSFCTMDGLPIGDDNLIRACNEDDHDCQDGFELVTPDEECCHCAPVCGNGQHHEPQCACQRTCDDRNPTCLQDQTSCVPGCTCPIDMYWDGENCLETCPCEHPEGSVNRNGILTWRIEDEPAKECKFRVHDDCIIICYEICELTEDSCDEDEELVNLANDDFIMCSCQPIDRCENDGEFYAVGEQWDNGLCDTFICMTIGYIVQINQLCQEEIECLPGRSPQMVEGHCCPRCEEDHTPVIETTVEYITNTPPTVSVPTISPRTASTPPPDCFVCDNSACIPTANVCDGSQHCVDGTDEANCEATTVTATTVMETPVPQCSEACNFEVSCEDKRPMTSNTPWNSRLSNTQIFACMPSSVGACACGSGYERDIESNQGFLSTLYPATFANTGLCVRTERLSCGHRCVVDHGIENIGGRWQKNACEECECKEIGGRAQSECFFDCRIEEEVCLNLNQTLHQPEGGCCSCIDQPPPGVTVPVPPETCGDVCIFRVGCDVLFQNFNEARSPVVYSATTECRAHRSTFDCACPAGMVYDQYLRSNSPVGYWGSGMCIEIPSSCESRCEFSGLVYDVGRTRVSACRLCTCELVSSAGTNVIVADWGCVDLTSSGCQVPTTPGPTTSYTTTPAEQCDTEGQTHVFEDTCTVCTCNVMTQRFTQSCRASCIYREIGCPEGQEIYEAEGICCSCVPSATTFTTPLVSGGSTGGYNTGSEVPWGSPTPFSTVPPLPPCEARCNCYTGCGQDGECGPKSGCNSTICSCLHMNEFGRCVVEYTVCPPTTTISVSISSTSTTTEPPPTTTEEVPPTIQPSTHRPDCQESCNRQVNCATVDEYNGQFLFDVTMSCDYCQCIGEYIKDDGSHEELAELFKNVDFLPGSGYCVMAHPCNPAHCYHNTIAYTIGTELQMDSCEVCECLEGEEDVAEDQRRSDWDNCHMNCSIDQQYCSNLNRTLVEETNGCCHCAEIAVTTTETTLPTCMDCNYIMNCPIYRARQTLGSIPVSARRVMRCNHERGNGECMCPYGFTPDDRWNSNICFFIPEDDSCRVQCEYDGSVYMIGEQIHVLCMRLTCMEMMPYYNNWYSEWDPSCFPVTFPYFSTTTMHTVTVNVCSDSCHCEATCDELASGHCSCEPVSGCEDCVCETGFYRELSISPMCIRDIDCQCQYDGMTYEEGEEFWKGDCLLCTCSAGDSVCDDSCRLTEASCSEELGQVLQQEAGICCSCVAVATTTQMIVAETTSPTETTRVTTTTVAITTPRTSETPYSHTTESTPAPSTTVSSTISTTEYTEVESTTVTVTEVTVPTEQTEPVTLTQEVTTEPTTGTTVTTTRSVESTTTTESTTISTTNEETETTESTTVSTTTGTIPYESTTSVSTTVSTPMETTTRTTTIRPTESSTTIEVTTPEVTTTTQTVTTLHERTVTETEATPSRTTVRTTTTPTGPVTEVLPLSPTTETLTFEPPTEFSTGTTQQSTTCNFNLFIYNVGEPVPTDDPCQTISCTDDGIVTNTTTCDTTCEDGTLRYVSGVCCPRCEPLNACNVVTKLTDLQIGQCYSADTVTHTACRGSCSSGANSTLEDGNIDLSCKCCQPADYSMATVALICDDGATQEHEYMIIDSCECLECEYSITSTGPPTSPAGTQANGL